MGIDVYSEILNEVSQFGTGLLWWCESIEITLNLMRVFLSISDRKFCVRAAVSNNLIGKGHGKSSLRKNVALGWCCAC